MNHELNYKSNPLNGVSLKQLVTEIVEHYGYEILHAYLNLNCFKYNPSIPSSVNFLKKTEWTREKVEAFYLYQYSNLPKASYEQQQIPPRDRIIPDNQKPGKPTKLTVEEAEFLREQKAEQASAYNKNLENKVTSKPNKTTKKPNSPWAKYRHNR